MKAYSAPRDVMLRHWEGETTAVARLPAAGTTHLIGSEALAVVQTVLESRNGLALRDIGHELGLDVVGDAAFEVGLQRIIDGLVQSGLLCHVTDDAEPGREGLR